MAERLCDEMLPDVATFDAFARQCGPDATPADIGWAMLREADALDALYAAVSRRKPAA